MIYLLYDIVQFLLLPVVVPYQMNRSLKRGMGLQGFGERFGLIQREAFHEPCTGETIWVHAVSVGETIAVRPLLVALKKQYPKKRILLSTVTETGRAVSEKFVEIDCRVYFPFDNYFFVRRSLKAVRPSLVIIVETEIWPNFLRAAKNMGIPVVLTNGRISDRSFGRYLKLKWFFRPVLANVTALCMQTAEDAKRIIAIGANPARVNVSGNLKYDIPVNTPTAEMKSELRTTSKIPDDILVVTAGSTHEGEEEIILSVYRRLQAEGRECLLILVPRHPERKAQIAELLTKSSIPFTLHSALNQRKDWFRAGEVLLVDTMGELMRYYAISDLSFVGGSLVPTGGHNIMEPASLGVPVIFGPNMQNFRESAALIQKYGGGFQVKDGTELTALMHDLLDDDEKRCEAGRNGMKLLQENSGATRMQMEVIAEFLKVDQ